MINQILGNRYEIQQQLAKKAGRRTLLVRDLQSAQLVVVKLLVFGNDFAWDDLKLFEREAKILKTLSHPSIPQYLDYFELDSPNFKGFALVQTYIPAKSLEEHLKAGVTFTEAQVKQLAIALLEILIYLHERQPPVIHRDLKPSNILLTVNNGVYLVDFGSVQTLAAREGGTMTVVGTYGYMPPEQFGDRATPASDLYSLGATLIALITGTHPADLPHKDGRIQFEAVARVSAGFSRWLRLVTEPSLDRRLASAKLALQALNSASNHLALTQVATKPYGSKIELRKTAEALEIILPPQGFSADLVGLTLFAIAWISGIAMWTAITIFSAPSEMNLFFALFSLPFWGAGISMVWQITATLFRRVRLTINQQQISRTYEIFGWRYDYARPAPFAEINKLEIEYSSNDKGKIIIWAGTQKYELGDRTRSDDVSWMAHGTKKQKYNFGYGAITEPELEWLAYELSDRLGLPTQVKLRAVKE